MLTFCPPGPEDAEHAIVHDFFGMSHTLKLSTHSRARSISSSEFHFDAKCARQSVA